MKNSRNRNKKLQRILAAALCACLTVMLLPFSAAALEGETQCDLETCLGEQCEQQDCLCLCHQTGETTVCSEPVTVLTEAAETTAATEESEAAAAAETVAETAEETIAETTEETVAETTEETVAETIEETVPETTEETVPETEEEAALTLTWLDQNGEFLAEAVKESGAVLTAEDFPELENVGWYVCDEENNVTDVPAKTGDGVDQSLTLRAVDRSVSLYVSGECAVGSEVTLWAELTGFAGETYEIRWQNCPIDEEGVPQGEWTDVEDADQTEYTYTITEDAQNLSWRVVLTVR